MKKKQTPLEKLIADKALLREQCHRQEQQLNDTFVYIHDHSGRLLLSAFSLLLFGSLSTRILIRWGMGKIQSSLLRWLKKIIFKSPRDPKMTETV